MAEELFQREFQQKLSDLYRGEGRSRVDCEIILPEYKEEAQRIIRMDTTSRVTKKNVYLRGQSLVCELDGIVAFQILYLTDRGGEKGCVSSFLSRENFSYTFKIPYEGDTFDPSELLIFTELSQEGEVVKLQGPRKISARCDVMIQLDAKHNRSLSFYPEKLGEDIETRGKKIRLAKLFATHEEEMVFTETITLPKAYLPVGEICQMDAGFFAQNAICENGGISFTGKCDLNLSYTAQEEDLFTGFYQPIEFQKRIGIPGVQSGQFCSVQMKSEFLRASVEVNEEGENKNIVFEIGLSCQVQVFENEECTVLRDAFSTTCALNMENEKMEAEEILGVTDFSVTVRDQIPLSAPSIFRAEGIRSMAEFKNCYLDEGKIFLEGKCKFTFIGIDEKDEMKNYEDSFDFKCELPSGAIQIPENKACRIELLGGARSLELEPDGESLRIRMDLDGSMMVFSRESFTLVSSLERGEVYGENEESVLFVYPEEGEDLWSLAKRYHISPAKLKAENEIKEEALPVFLKVIR